MVDRLWRLWQLQHPGGNPDASLLDQALPPFRMTGRQTLDVTALGYDYARRQSQEVPDAAFCVPAAADSAARAGG
jgi:hypothetical protein